MVCSRSGGAGAVGVATNVSVAAVVVGTTAAIFRGVLVRRPRPSSLVVGVDVVAAIVVGTTAAIFGELLLRRPRPSSFAAGVDNVVAAYLLCFLAFLAAFFSWFFVVFDFTKTAQATTVDEPVAG